MDLPDTVVTSLVAALREIVGDDFVSEHPDGRRHASRDHAWMSPVLRARLDELPIADLVVLPGSRAELAAVLGACHRARVPLTVRGRGTGHAGRALPLAGGVVVDTTRLDTIIEVADGSITAEAGTSFLALEAEARHRGQELAIYPTTTGSALAGFIAAGGAGVGSAEHGATRDGTVLAVEVLPYVDEPTPRWIEGDDALVHIRAAGTTGVIAAARVRLEPARIWWSLWASFPTFEAARRAGDALLGLDPVPRLVSIDDPDVWALFPSDAAFRDGCVSLRAMIAVTEADEAERIVAEGGGTVEAVREHLTAQLAGLASHHVTLRAQRARASICQVQVAGDALVDDPEGVRACLPNGMLHLDSMARDGRPGWVGLVLSDYVDEPTLRAGIDALGALGLDVADGHDWGVDADDAMLAAAAELDPDGLLNPGKLRR